MRFHYGLMNIEHVLEMRFAELWFHNRVFLTTYLLMPVSRLVLLLIRRHVRSVIRSGRRL